MARASFAFRAALLLLTVGIASPAGAAQRTFVASSGNDSHPCSLTQPCRTFTAALARTDADGELIVLDSAGYGPVTITQSVSIIAPHGIYAGITPPLGTSGVTVNGGNIVVALSGLTINGEVGGSVGTVGIDFIDGAQIAVEDCEISNFETDVHVHAANSKTIVTNTVLRGALDEFLADGSLDALLDRVHMSDGSDGVKAQGGARVTVANSTMAENAASGVTVLSFGGGTTDVMATHTTISGGQNGVFVEAAPGSSARVVSDAMVVTDVSHWAFRFAGSGGTETIYSPTNNTVGSNSAAVTGGALSSGCCVH